MNRKPSKPIRLGQFRPPLPCAWSYRPNLIPLEDRLLLSVTRTTFSLDLNNSTLALAGRIGSTNIQAQGPGALDTKYTGNLVAQWDLTAATKTIEFIQAGTAATALDSGNWKPPPASAPANYGINVTSSTFNTNVAIHGLTAAVTSGPLTLTQTRPGFYTFQAAQSLTITAGTADYDAGGGGSINLANTPPVPNRAGTTGTFQDLGNGTYRLTTPLNFTITETIAGMTATWRFIGNFISNSTAIPVVNLGGPGGDYSTQVVPRQGPVNITAGTATVTSTTSLMSMTATLTNHPDEDMELLDAVASGGLNASYNATTGVETITGTATAAVYQTVLRTLTYANNSMQPDTTDRLIRVVAQDVRGNVSVVRTSTVTVFLPLDHLLVYGFPSPTPACTAGSFTVAAVDANDTIVTAYIGRVSFSSTDLQAMVPADYTFTESDRGVHTFSANTGMPAILKTVGTQSITAMDLTTNISGSQDGIQVDPGTTDHFIVTTTAADPDVAGTPFDVTVTAMDSCGNIGTNYTGTVQFTSSDTNDVYPPTLPPDYTFQASDQGMVTFAGGVTLFTAGSWTVTATDPDSGITGSATISVTPAAVDHFMVTTLAANPQDAGTPFDVTVTAQDAYNNTVTDYTGDTSFTSRRDPLASFNPANYTFTAADMGVHFFGQLARLCTPGTQDVTIIDANSVSGSANVNVQAGMAAGFIIDAPDSVASQVRFDITVTAIDSCGNTSDRYRGKIHFDYTPADPAAILPADYTFLANDRGVHTFTDTGRHETTLHNLGSHTILVMETPGQSNLSAMKDIMVTQFTGPSGPGGWPIASEPARFAPVLEQSAVDRLFAPRDEEQQDSRTLAVLAQAVTHTHRGTASHSPDIALLDDLAWLSIV